MDLSPGCRVVAEASVSDVKESKAQRAERLKRELNPWEAYETIERFAREGHASIPPEWGTYFRWWGIYSQGDGVGAVGGTGGEGRDEILHGARADPQRHRGRPAVPHARRP